MRKIVSDFDNEWTTELLSEIYETLEHIAVDEWGYNLYPNQIEIISSEGMLEAYATVGLPVMYTHWSFGKRYLSQSKQYKAGLMGLAYEIVINCLSDASIVHTDRGILTIKDTKIGDLVWDGKSFVPILSKQSRVKDSGIEIITVSGRKVSSSREHRYPVITDKGFTEKEASNIIEGDYLLIPKQGYHHEAMVDLRKFEYVPPTHWGEKFMHVSYCRVPDHMTEELAELLGIIIGDGSISPTDQHFYIIVGWPDTGYENHVRDLIRKVFDFDPLITLKPSNNSPEKNNTLVTVCSAPIKKFLEYCGLPGTSTYRNKRVPWSVMQASTACRAAFLRGLFDTDGGVKHSHGVPQSVGFSCYNEDLGEDVSELLNSVGIKHTIKRRKNNDSSITAIDIHSHSRFTFREMIGSSIERKAIALEGFALSKFSNDSGCTSVIPEYFENKSNGNRPGRTKFLNDVLDDHDLSVFSNYHMVKVEEVRQIDKLAVTDIGVNSRDHYFVANGFVTHNSNPCISYLMESNTLAMQTLVMAHAGIGHNAFFKNNYLFKQWTQPDWIIDYLGYAKRYIVKCEEKYGIDAVETLLDAVHSIEVYSVDKYNRVNKTKEQLEDDFRRRVEWEDSQYDILVEPFRQRVPVLDDKFVIEPTDNLLYFIEKNAPNLEVWQREIIRIVRKVGQYFYPQRQLQLMNEGFATVTHSEMSHELWDRGLVDERYMLEFLTKHSAVLGQQSTGHGSPLKYLSPYKLGYEMFMDIKRRCQNPTKEDEYWFPEQINRPFREVWFEAVAGYKDESFITQYLSPEVVRKMKLMSILDTDKDEQNYKVSGISDDESFEHMRKYLSRQYDFGSQVPQISVYDVNWSGDRTLKLRHEMQGRRPLDNTETTKVLQQIYSLWQFPVIIESIDKGEGKKLHSYP